ncbi:zinc finger protein 40 [Denticeps clupeoides]|uniref:Zinc finger protein 40 n=1 Tax=Denticeps clupeoides TaxID=299321 RepID=A0AAY4DQZ9_9TELE|nr:zinc finger protein 40 [Denticeps clupeoides]XP_028819244.1 zinc finger protein 40 [Denticeps clupeoides]XP_028819245.1 zinc finger protein 40 [Denticeps clupeoides]
MPRTKQNHPKNLKDKIEEAQKELKDPKGSQKDISESTSRSLDNIKGLKRKKVVGENQLKKIPKSPVKKQSHTKTLDSVPQFVSSGEGNISDSLSCNPLCSPSSTDPENTDHDQKQVAQTPEKVNVDGNVSELHPLDQISSVENPELCISAGGVQENWGDRTEQGNSSAHTSAPLDVLLKAMEPDFNTLTKEVGHNFETCVAAQCDVSAAIPTVKFGPQSQPPLMQPCNTAKQFYHGNPVTLKACAPASNQAAPMQSSSLQFVTLAGRLQPEKTSFRKGYSEGQSAALTHAPVPSGSSALPQSQPPVVQTCQSLSASVPSTIQVPVTPGYNTVQMATVVNFSSLEQVGSVTAKEQKPKKQGKYVCEYCSRACAKPSVLLKHIRSHTGERPYPCVTCGFSFKTKSNLYKHKKSHAHAIKLGLVVRSDSGSGSLSQESDKTAGTHSDVDESGESDEESSTADIDQDSSQSSVTGLSESSLQSSATIAGGLGEPEHAVASETLKTVTPQKGIEPKVTAALPKVVVYPVNVSPLRADSPRVTDSTPEQATAQRQREFQPASLRSNVMVLSSLKEVDCSSPFQESISEDEDLRCKSPPGSGHAQLQRQQATDQQQQGKSLLSPRSLGSTDSGYFSRSESADQAMSPPSPMVKIPLNPLNPPPVVAPVMHVTAVEKSAFLVGQMRPPLETKTLSLEERISKLISDNEAVVDDKQLDSVKPRRTSLSRRGSIDSPKSYIFKDSFQFDLRPMGRRSSSSSDIPKSPFTPTDKSKQVFLLSVPPQYPHVDCLPITRSNSMPTTPGHSALLPNLTPQPYPLRTCHSFDDKISPLNDDVFSSAPSTPNPAVYPRTLVRQKAVEDFSTSDGHGLPSVRSMDEGYHGSSMSAESIQRSKSFEQGPDRNRKTQHNKGTMFECETCRNRYRKLENFENHKKFYCSELHGPKNKPIPSKDSEPDLFVRGMQQPIVTKTVGVAGIVEQPTLIRKRRKMKSVGDDEDQSPTDKNPPCSGSFDSCQASARITGRQFSQQTIMVDFQQTNSPAHIHQIQLMAGSMDSSETRLSPIRESQISPSTIERGELQRQGSGTSVIRHTNSLSRPNSFETSESIDRASPIDTLVADPQNTLKSSIEVSVNSSLQNYHEKMSTPKCASQDKFVADRQKERTLAVVSAASAPPQQSKLVRQNNIQVPEILVTEEPDREHENQAVEPPEKPLDTFNWPQRSESLSKLPTEKLPPKKKRIRLAQMDHSSGDSSFDSTLSRSLSRDSSLSRCSSISASFERDEPLRSDSPSRLSIESTGKPPEVQGLPMASNTLGIPSMMRRAASEQISCTQPSVEIYCEYRSKSFDCTSTSPNRSLSPMETALPKTAHPASIPHIPLIERRRGPLVRQMSLKIGPENQQPVGKQHTVSLQRAALSNIFSVSQQRSQIVNRPNVAQPFVLQSEEAPLQKNEQMVQSINLGSQTQHPPVHGLPHPWHQTSKVVVCGKLKPVVQTMNSHSDTETTSSDSENLKNFVPKYQLQCQTSYTYSGGQGTPIALPVITIPIASDILTVSKSPEGVHKTVYMAQQSQQGVPSKTSIVLPVGLQADAHSHSPAASSSVPQIVITHEQIHPSSTLRSKTHFSSANITNSDNKTGSVSHMERPQAQLPGGIIPHIQNHAGEIRSTPSLGSLHCTQKLASANLCPQQETTASSKRMLSPANSLDIAMEKHQKRAKDEHGAVCQPTDGRSVSYLNSKMAEVTRQRKFTLVRQVCTTEPVDSPIESEAPQQELEKLETNKGSQITDAFKTTTPEMIVPGIDNSVSTATDQPMLSPATHTSQGVQSYSLPSHFTLKQQDKVEEQRWSPARSPVRPLGFQGQVKLASSVSVVNTRDSHRLSFPSLKTATTFTWCYLMKRKPLHILQTDQRVSAYATWAISPTNPNPLGLPTKVVMSLFDSKQKSKKIHYTQAITTSLKSDILTYSSKLKDLVPKILTTQKSVTTASSSKAKTETQHPSEPDKESKSEPRRIKIFDGGYKSNEEYVYVRGRGRGKYICEECGIRCKKPSMLRKHIRTHSDVRPYHCTHCNFSFKTKGNLTKHMKSKAHSKKCLEMGVSVGHIEDQDPEDSGDRGRINSGDRPDSDADESDGPEDEDNDGEEEDEEDSQAESGLSTTPSVSASPQHLPSAQTDMAPSSLLAQMSISSAPNPLPQASTTDFQTSDAESVAMMSPVSPNKPLSRSHPGPVPFSSPLTSDSHTSDTESVHMMSPVSPCRQMSIDYPEFDMPPSPPALMKDPKPSQQDGVASSSSTAFGEAGLPVDRGTQTSSYAPHFPTQGSVQDVGTHTHLFSHLPLHSQQPSRSPYSMIPVGGIQLVPAGLAAYSTFVPIQAGPVQLTIPAVSVIHRNSSPLPAPSTSPQPEGSPSQPLVVQESIGGVLPCFPLGQVAGLQTLGTPQTLQPVGLETLSVMGLANSALAPTQLLPPQNVALSATLGVQVLAASPTVPISTAPQAHIPGLQILNIALPALIPSLSPLSALSPLPMASDKQGNVDVPVIPAEQATGGPVPSASGSQPASVPVAPAVAPRNTPPNVPSSLAASDGAAKDVESRKKSKTPPLTNLSTSPSPTDGGQEAARRASAAANSDARAPPKQPIHRQATTDDYNEASSDDEDRLVIAT